MTKRRDLVRILKSNGFDEAGGTNHGRFEHPDGRYTYVPRHREVKTHLAVFILKQAGIDTSSLEGLK